MVFQNQVAVDGLWKVCPEAGGPIQYSGFNGKPLAFLLLYIQKESFVHFLLINLVGYR